MCVSRPSRKSKGIGVAGLLLVVLAVWQVLLVQRKCYTEWFRLHTVATKGTYTILFDLMLTVVWFRNDLRVHDNEALATANRESTSLLPVYCFDPREFGTSVNGISSTGPYRAQ